MTTMRELETLLRNIRLAVRGAVDAVTGQVDDGVLGAQAELLKQWTFDFEKTYIHQAPKKPLKRQQILVEGKIISEHAWFCCECLWHAEMEAGAAQPALPRWDVLPSGRVIGDAKAELDTEISALLVEFNEYRRNVLEE